MTDHTPAPIRPPALDAELAAAQTRIAELTEELDATNRGVVALLADLDQARVAEAQALADQQVAAERERIAHDLYQQVIHKMFGAGLTLQGTLGLIQHRQAATQVRTVIADLDVIIADLRAAVFGALEHRKTGAGLRARIADLAAEAGQDRDLHPAVAFQGPLDETVPDDAAAELLGAGRTLLMVLPHPAAAVELQAVADADLSLALAYDGPAPEETHALRALRTRAEDLGGALVVDTPAAGRVRVRWRVPVTWDDQPGVG